MTQVPFGDQPVGAAVQPCPLAAGPQGGAQQGGGPQTRETHWVEIELVGEDDQPVADEDFHLLLPDGREVTGRLDANGHARIDGIAQAGDCKVCFPHLDADAWAFIETAGPRDA